MNFRRLVGIVLVVNLLFSCGVAFASDKSDPTEQSEGEHDSGQLYVYVTPQLLIHGITVKQALHDYAPDDPGAWISAEASSEEPIAVDSLVCTGMWLHRTDGEAEEPVVIVVQGDVLGNGRMSLVQLLRIAALTRSSEGVDEIIRIAADINQDGTIGMSDLCAAALPLREMLPPPAEEVASRILDTDVLEYIPTSTYQTDGNQKWYRPVLNRRDLTLSLSERYRAWLAAAVDKLHFENINRIETDFEVPSWPLLAAIAANCKDDPDGMRSVLSSAVDITVSTTRDRDGTVLEISTRPVDPAALFYDLPSIAPSEAFSLSTSYAYLSTVFDDAMNERYGIGYPDLEALLFPIARPSRYYVGDCWYLPRDQGARKHTGTDINAPRGTDLLACVNGTIIGNGWDNVAGNYIVLRDGDGTQYHYYHMVELSDVPIGTQVRRGEIIGHVGSTGNSRANHLHFTIITSGGQYVNPVGYLQTAQTATVNGSIRPE